MSTTTMGTAAHFPAATKPRRTWGRWLQIELRAAMTAWRRHRRHLADARALRALDDRMLSDIGLNRGQIDAAVRGQR